jgi:hypothetical protein
MDPSDSLPAELIQKVLAQAPPGSWIIARRSDGKILGIGKTGSQEALQRAQADHPDLRLDEVVVLWKSAPGKEPETPPQSRSKAS